MDINSYSEKRKIVASARLSERLALIALIVYVAANLLFAFGTLQQTYPVFTEMHVLNICNAVALACAIVSIATKSRGVSAWQGVLVAVVLSILLYSAARTGDYSTAFGFIVILAVADIRLERICTVYYRTLFVTTAFLVLLAAAGFISSKDYIQNSLPIFSFGFNHPSGFGAALFAMISAMGIVMWQKEQWVIPFALSIVSTVFSYIVLRSYLTAFILGLLAVALLIGHIKSLSRLTNIPQKAFFAILIIVPLALMSTMFAGTLFYSESNSTIVFLDNMLQGRLRSAHEYYVSYGGFTHLGRKYTYVSIYHAGGHYVGTSIGYLFLPLVTGLLSMYALFAVYAIAVWRISKTNRHFLVFAILLISSFYMTIETYPLYIALSPAFLFLSAAFESSNAPPADTAKPALKSPALERAGSPAPKSRKIRRGGSVAQ